MIWPQFLVKEPVRQWLLGGARLHRTHTLVKLTLCNGCYLITENSRGRNQVSLCWREKLAQRQHQPVCLTPTGGGADVASWAALFRSTELFGAGDSYSNILFQGREGNGQRRNAPPTETWITSAIMKHITVLGTVFDALLFIILLLKQETEWSGE